MDPQPPAQRLDLLGVLSLVLSIGAFMTVWCCIGYPIGLVAVVLGAVALSRNASGGYSPTSRALAISGIAITAFAIVLHVILIAVGQVAKPELPTAERTVSATPATTPPVAPVSPPAPENPTPPTAPQVVAAPKPEPEPPVPPVPAPDPLPASQRAFCDAVKSGADGYRAAKSGGANELKLSKLRSIRKSAVSAAIPGGTFKSWVGTVDSLQTTGDGKAILIIDLDCDGDVKLATWNNAMSDFSDKTLIPQSSALYDAISEIAVGTLVKVSGKFVRGDVDGFGEQSVTENGSMIDPAYTVRFSGISSGK